MSDKFRELKDRFSAEFPYEAQHPLGLRMRRILSWYERALNEPSDPDARFIFSWIAFNSAYGIDDSDRLQQGLEPVRELDRQYEFFENLVPLDENRALFDVLHKDTQVHVHNILDNEYIFRAFWMFEKGQQRFEKWLDMLEEQHVRVARAYRECDTMFILKIVFERLYVLRNQLLHGGATYNSKVNRDQVVAGDAIMISLLPVIAELMMDGSDIDWGVARYPVIA